MPKLNDAPQLTKAYVDRITPPEKPYTLHWDSSVRGFGLRVTSAGKKTYFVQGRVKGKSIRITIGEHGIVTVKQARDIASKHLLNMKDDIDPRQVKREAAVLAVTLREVADKYLQDIPLKNSSKREIERHITTTFRGWMHQPIASITRTMVSDRFIEMRDHGLHGHKPAPSQANQSFSIFRALYNFSIREYRRADDSAILTDNPCDVLYKKWVPVKPRTGRIPESKVGAVWYMLETACATAYSSDILSGINLVQFLLLTGSRFTEAASLTWDRVNLEENWWHIPNPKNSNPVWLPLSSTAAELLAARPRVKGSNFVFASALSKSGHIMNPRATMEAVSKTAGLNLAPHDLRRTFSTIAVDVCDIPVFKLERLTNHAPRSVTERHYLQTSHLEKLLPEVQQIADWIIGQAAIAEAQATGTNVVPLHG